MRIDSHHHFWKYSAKEYDWISNEMSVIRRDFLPPHLSAEIKQAGIDAVVSVQARQSVEETRFLLDFASRNPFIKGVVGWVPLVAKDAARQIEAFHGHPKLRGFRHVVQGEPDDAFILRPDFNEGIKALHHWGYIYDILIFEKHLPNSIVFVDRHPQQVFVIDHIAKPVIKTNSFDAWAKNMREMAKRSNVYCKVSGMVTEADWKNWKPADLKPYVDAAVQAFGPQRCMYGSDWPVSELAASYEIAFSALNEALGTISTEEQNAIYGETAKKFYGLQ